ncbi:MAG: type II glyceraldehyde-3-phosphate dehydrogenase [Candidatus Methylomirabilales bacterium]
MIRVGVNGFGTIGRRVADAIICQPDMELVGVAKVRPDYKAGIIARRGFRLYGVNEKAANGLQEAGYKVEGTLSDLLGRVDVIVDTVPAKLAKENRALYEAAGVRAIFQGGEKADIAEVSFNAQANYEQAWGRRSARVISCNSTGLTRAIHTLHTSFGIERARAILARKATDPDDPRSGPVNAVLLDPCPANIPTHHGSSVNTVLPEVKVFSSAVRIPSTIFHFHTLFVTVRERRVTEEQVVKAFEAATRIIFVDSREGIGSTAELFDYTRELGRLRPDLYELAVWKDTVKVDDGEVFLHMAVHMEAIVIPENIDCIRSLCQVAPKAESIRMTNEALGIMK